MEDAFRAAHTIKGICQNLSLTALLKAASELTEALRNKTEYSNDIEPYFENLKEIYTRTISYINEFYSTQE